MQNTAQYYMPVTKYLYNGKELQDDQLGGVNLDLYDYHARMYDPAIGRFTTQDPLAEYHLNITPYHYVENNPLRYIDPFGLDKEDREERRRKRRERRDKKNFPDTEYIPEVRIVGKKKDKEEQGISFTTEDGADSNGNPNSKVWFEINYDVINWLHKVFKQKQLRKQERQPTEESIAKKTIELAKEVTSDEEIVKNHTGTTENTTNRGEPVSQLEQRVKKHGRDSLPIVCSPLPSYWEGEGLYSYDKEGKRHGPFQEGDTIRWEYYEDGQRTGDYRLTR